MTLPLVAIVGRPNVGKSSLFNKLIGKPVSIVDPTAGVTRDRVIHTVHRDPYLFELVDTGGIGIVDEAKLEVDIESQIRRAIDTADKIIFLCDGKDGVTDLDREIGALLRPVRERVILAINKLDHENLDSAIHEFHSLGMLNDPMVVSAEQIRGFPELLDAVCGDFPSADELERDSAYNGVKICLVGRRNVGKSSITNELCGDERVIVADYAGTTRDAIDVPLHTPFGDFLLIDTAGLRRKKQLKQDLEFYAACRTERGIHRADVAILVLDASEEIGHVDKKIGSYCEAAGKPTIIIVNKWDIAKENGATEQQFHTWLEDRLPGLRWAPILFTSATEQIRINEILPLAVELMEEYEQRVSTSELNKLLENAVTRRRPRKIGSSATKVYYATQAETAPPTFTVFVNRTDWIEAGYSRYLENFFRKYLPFKRVPYRIIFKARHSQFRDMHDDYERLDVRSKADRNAQLIVPKGKFKRVQDSSGKNAARGNFAKHKPGKKRRRPGK